MASMVELPGLDNTFYDTIPDGGYGWVIVFCGFLSNFVIFGIPNVWGVFSNAYATGVLERKATTLELMGVGSLMIIMLNLFSPVGPLCARLGINVIMGIGTFLIALGIVLAGFSTKIWHLYLTMGLVFGFGSSLIYISNVSAIPQWFSKRRGTAMGISSAGTGFGGLVFSPLVTSLVGRYGLPWTHRIVGLMALVICMIASCLIRSRLPPGTEKLPIKSPIKPRMLKNVEFVIMLFGVIIALFGYLIPLFYLPTYARSFGIDSTDSSNLVGVACAMNALGRMVLGYIADRIGRLNMFTISSIFSGLVCMLLWPFAKTYGTLMAFAVLFGFTCGVYYTLAAPITASVVESENVSSGISILFVLSSIAALGPPISSAIQIATPDNGFIGIQMFSGSVYILGAIICISLKLKITGSLFSVI